MALLGGMFIATLVGVFLYPMFFVAIGKLGKYEKKRELAAAKKPVTGESAEGTENSPIGI
jgi:HAE1 family hydrophobic/amphiphilic exporter-1